MNNHTTPQPTGPDAHHTTPVQAVYIQHGIIMASRVHFALFVLYTDDNYNY